MERFVAGVQCKQCERFFQSLHEAIDHVCEGNKEPVAHADNIDYTAALTTDLNQLVSKGIIRLMDISFIELAKRLNSVVKAQQNCV